MTDQYHTESLLLMFIMADFARIIYIISIFMNHINPIQNGGRGKMATTSFSSVTSANVGISP